MGPAFRWVLRYVAITYPESLLVPGGRVLNPQSYHSAFRISSTRYEETLAGRRTSMMLNGLATKKMIEPTRYRRRQTKLGRLCGNEDGSNKYGSRIRRALPLLPKRCSAFRRPVDHATVARSTCECVDGSSR
jgi:hypothetical protein